MQEVTIVSRPMRLPLPGLLLVVALTAPGCDEPEAFTPPPTEVSVVEVSAGRLEEVHEFTGNVEASRSVQVRAQVGAPSSRGHGTKAQSSRRFREAGDTLAGLRLTRDQLVAQHTQVQALERALTLAQRRYESGVSSYLEVLDAQRGLFSAQLALAQTERLYLSSTVRLYKAVGGGRERESRR